MALFSCTAQRWRFRSVCLSYQKGRADELRASPTPTPCGCPSWPGQLSALCLALPALRVLSPGSGPRSLASRISPSAFPPQHGDSGSHHPGAGHCCITGGSGGWGALSRVGPAAQGQETPPPASGSPAGAERPRPYAVSMPGLPACCGGWGAGPSLSITGGLFRPRIHMTHENPSRGRVSVGT